MTSSDALVPNSLLFSNSFLLLLVRNLLLVAMHLFLVAYCIKWLLVTTSKDLLLEAMHLFLVAYCF